MPCKGCGNNQHQPSFPKLTAAKVIGTVQNLSEAAASQTNKFKWFRDGITGLVKCFNGKVLYSDEQIKENRLKCQDCEFATKSEQGTLTVNSQCMAPDPAQNGAKCGCFIVCKTQSDKCPIGKFTNLTITAKFGQLKSLHDQSDDVNII